MIVLTVEMTDLIFSLDNVVAAVTLSEKFWVVMLGVAIGILMMRFAAGLFSYAVQREPILKNAAYLLVLIIGAELLFSELTGIDINEWLRFGISAGTIILCLVYAHLPFRKVLHPVVAWFARGFSRINSLVNWLLEPFFAIFRLLFSAGRAVAFHLTPKQDQSGD
jgi:tellurite resistance protein TerC